MKKVVLIFPHTAALAEFVLTEQVSNAEVHSAERSLTAYLTDVQIVKASTQYSAILRTLVTTTGDRED